MSGPRARLRRPALLIVAAALPLLLLSACHPGGPSGTATGSSKPTAASASTKPTATPAPTATAAALPADAYLSVTSTVKADNGATATMTAIVHQPLAPTDAAASAMVARMADVCSGEVDASVLASQKAMMVRVDYSSTVTSGTWPTDLILELAPTSAYANLAAAGDPGVTQHEPPDPTPQPGDYTPNCLQSGFLTVGQSGAMFLAQYIDPSGASYLDNDSFWSHQEYGFLTNQGPARVTYTGCDYHLTALGTAHLGGNTSFQRNPGGDATALNPSICTVGGLTGY